MEIVSDNSVYIRDAVNDVLKTIIEGSLLAVAMVFLFLKDWRSTLISSLSIPISIIATFFAMKSMAFFNQLHVPDGAFPGCWTAY